MDKTYCMVHLSECLVSFYGVNADHYTAIWDDTKNERYNIRKPLIDKFEKEWEVNARELKTLVDDRTFWQKFCGVKTETSKRIAELNNKQCGLLDDIFDLKANIIIKPSELYPKLLALLAAEDFATLDHGCVTQVWVKEHK